MRSTQRHPPPSGEPGLTLVVRNLADGTFVLTYRRRELPVLAEDLRTTLEEVLELDPTTIVIEIASRAEIAGDALIRTLAWIAREMRDRHGHAWLGIPDPVAPGTSLVPVAEALDEHRQRRRVARWR